MIDILLATYNGEAYIESQVKSLLTQTYQDFRIIVRDDGSMDRTRELLLEYQKEYKDQVQVINDREPTGSARDNFFQLLQHSDGDYTMFCDQDDVWLIDKVEKTLKLMREVEGKAPDSPVLAHTDLSVVDESLHEISTSLCQMQKLNPEYKSLSRLVAQNNITGCTMMINRALREILRPNGGALMHDWWIGLTAAAFGRICFLPEPTILYRQHAKNEVGAQDVASNEYFRDKLQNKQGIRESIVATYLQAKAFCNCYEDMLDNSQIEMLCAYAGLRGVGKMNRFGILQKYHCFKSGWMRKVAQVIYG